MAIFEGSIYEFTKYLGAYCRIKVMHISTKYKKEKGACEDCKATEFLESAHVRGKERPLVISNILSEFINNDIIKIDLDLFEERFVEAHYPLESSLRILCRDCHRLYDSKKKVLPDTLFSEISEQPLNNDDLQEIKITEKLLSQTLNKSQALSIVNNSLKSNLKNINTLFANINSAVDHWWLQPSNEKFKTGFNFILNHSEKNTLYYFNFPANTVLDPQEIFYQRNDMDSSTIYIGKSETKFVDKKGYDFSKYLIEQIRY